MLVLDDEEPEQYLVYDGMDIIDMSGITANARYGIETHPEDDVFGELEIKKAASEAA